MKLEFGHVQKIVVHEGLQIDVGVAVCGVYLVRFMVNTKDGYVAGALFGGSFVLSWQRVGEQCPICRGRGLVVKIDVKNGKASPGRISECAKCGGKGRIS